MTIWAEMVRDLSSESNLINDSTNYTTSSTTFVTLKNFGNIVLASAGLVLIKFKMYCTATVSRVRIKIGGTYVYATRHTPTEATYSFFCFLAAGTYEVIEEGMLNNAGLSLGVSLFQLGYVNFSDLQGSALAAYAGAIAKTTTVRATPVGNIKNTVYCVTVYGITAGGQTNLENSGESLTNGVQVLLDGVQKAWGERGQGDVNDMPAGGKCYVSASAGSSHTVTITKDNANTVVNVSVAVCPWLLPLDSSEVVSLNFPAGSTLYVAEEPLDADPTKNVYVGKVRSISFGATTDYYSSASATGISIFSYTFEAINVAQCLLLVKGLGGCISIIAVDVR